MNHPYKYITWKDKIVRDFYEDILLGKYETGEMIPTVRELMKERKVSQKSATSAYKELQRQGIIYAPSTAGTFLSYSARTKVQTMMREEFWGERVPELFRMMEMLEIEMSEVLREWEHLMWKLKGCNILTEREPIIVDVELGELCDPEGEHLVNGERIEGGKVKIENGKRINGKWKMDGGGKA